MYMLLGLSVFSIGAMIERTLYFWRHRDDVDELGDRLIALLERRDNAGATALLKASKSIEASVIEPAMKFIDSGADALSDAIEGQMIRVRQELERGSTLLGTLGNNAPFIGLFGTIIGVIIAFHQLGTSQTGQSMNAVMGGIAEALVATGVGLFVAIPAVVAYNLVQKRIGDIEGNVAAIAKDMTALLKSEPRPGSAAAQADSTDTERESHQSGLGAVAAVEPN